MIEDELNVDDDHLGGMFEHPYSKFVLKYLSKSKDKCATFNDLVMRINRIEWDINLILKQDFMLRGVVDVVNKKGNTTTLKLKDEFHVLADLIEYDGDTTKPNGVHYFANVLGIVIRTTLKALLAVIMSPVVLLGLIWREETAKAIYLVSAILALIWTSIELYSWYYGTPMN